MVVNPLAGPLSDATVRLKPYTYIKKQREEFSVYKEAER
jgi:hypothetical protein